MHCQRLNRSQRQDDAAEQRSSNNTGKEERTIMWMVSRSEWTGNPNTPALLLLYTLVDAPLKPSVQSIRLHIYALTTSTGQLNQHITPTRKGGALVRTKDNGRPEICRFLLDALPFSFGICVRVNQGKARQDKSLSNHRL